jgi:rare lipoprotein A
VKAARILSLALGGIAAAALSGCFTAGRRPAPVNPEAPPAAVPQVTQPPPAIPLGFPWSVPDAVPRIEPRSRSGNPPFYQVFGKRYYVLSSATAYVERGVASWYGPGFHKVRTSTGDSYDMYGMSAAHKTLPLPAYARVTNLQNGRSVVVRVNDRGPFVGNRIIDLSYTAAAKLDMLRNGTAFVEVRAIDLALPTREQGAPLLAAGPLAPAASQSSRAPPATSANGRATGTVAPDGAASSDSPTATAATTANLASANGESAAALSGAAPRSAAKNSVALFVQAGAFADPANAERLAAKLRGGAYGKIFVRDDLIAGRKMYRVRIGPVPNVAEFDRIVAALDRNGVRDAHLAMD